MKLNLIPRPDAVTNNKRDWLIYQFVRYRNFHKVALVPLYVLDIALISVLVSVFGVWIGALIGFFILQLTNYAYDMATFSILKPFYADMGLYVFQEGKDTDSHDLRLLMNRVENFTMSPEGSILKGDRIDAVRECLADVLKRRGSDGNAQKGEVKAEV